MLNIKIHTVQLFDNPQVPGAHTILSVIFHEMAAKKILDAVYSLQEQWFIVMCDCSNESMKIVLYIQEPGTAHWCKKANYFCHESHNAKFQALTHCQIKLCLDKMHEGMHVLRAK